MKTPTITVDMDKKCSECGDAGAMKSGLCLKCVAKRIGEQANIKRAGKTDRYEASPEIEGVAERVIEEHHPHLAGARIAYLIRLLDRDPKGNLILPKDPSRAGKKRWAGKARLVSTLWQALTGFDFVIEIKEQFWRFMRPEQKEALVDHELCHCGCDDDGYYVRNHDVEEFTAILERHGLWHGGLEEFVSAQKQLPFPDVRDTQQSKSIQ
jgi:hypothetical protein